MSELLYYQDSQYKPTGYWTAKELYLTRWWVCFSMHHGQSWHHCFAQFKVNFLQQRIVFACNIRPNILHLLLLHKCWLKMVWISIYFTFLHINCFLSNGVSTWTVTQPSHIKLTISHFLISSSFPDSITTWIRKLKICWNEDAVW